MGMPLNLHRRGSFPGPLNGGYVNFDDQWDADVVAGGAATATFLWYIPFNFKLQKICITDFGAPTQATIQVAHTPVSAEAASTAIGSYNIQVTGGAADYDANRNANGYLVIGQTSEADIAFASESVREIPKDSFLKAVLTVTTGTATAPVGINVFGHPYGHLYVSPAND